MVVSDRQKQPRPGNPPISPAAASYGERSIKRKTTYYICEYAIFCQVCPPSVVLSNVIISPLLAPPPGSGNKCVRLFTSAQPTVDEIKAKLLIFLKVFHSV